MSVNVIKEGLWRTRGGSVVNVKQILNPVPYEFLWMSPNNIGKAELFWYSDGFCLKGRFTDDDLVEFIGDHEVESEAKTEDGSSTMKKQVGGTHYEDMAIQPIEIIKANFTPEEVRGFCRGNALKYLLRAGRKAGNSFANDIAKAKHFIEILQDFEDK